MNICIIGVPEEDREKGAGNVFEDMIAKNFPNWKGKTSRTRKHRSSRKSGQKKNKDTL